MLHARNNILCQIRSNITAYKIYFFASNRWRGKQRIAFVLEKVEEIFKNQIQLSIK